MLARGERYLRKTWGQILKPGELSLWHHPRISGRRERGGRGPCPACHSSGQRARDRVPGRASVEVAAGLGPADKVPGVRKPLGHPLGSALRKPQGAAPRSLRAGPAGPHADASGDAWALPRLAAFLERGLPFLLLTPISPRRLLRTLDVRPTCPSRCPFTAPPGQSSGCCCGPSSAASLTRARVW